MMSRPDAEDRLMSEQHRRVPEHVLRAGSAAATSPMLLEAIRAAESAVTTPDPARGQLWRAAWEDVTQLVVVLQVTGPGVAMVAPVTTDPPAADDISAILDADLTVLGQPATVWGGLAENVPFRVFDLLIGEVAAVVVDVVEQLAAGGHSDALPAGVRAGVPITSPFDPAAEARAELSDNLESLSSAVWIPQASGSARSLRELLKGRPDMPALMESLVEGLGLPLPAVIDIVMGRSPVTPDQADAVAEVTGLTAQQVLDAVSPLPAELVSELDRPRWRKALRARHRPGEPEAAARLTAAYGVLALAARQTGPTSARSWPQRIRQYLATQPSGESDR